MTKRRTGLWLAVVVVAFLLLVVPAFEVASEDLWVCEVTGSVRHHDTSWFSLVDKEWFEPSPLEEYLQNASPDEVEHRWVWMCRTGYNVLGSISHEDSFKPTFGLRYWINSPEFTDLPDDHKKLVFDVLVQTKAWTDKEKRQLYDNLSKLEGKELRAFIESSWEEAQKQQERANPRTIQEPEPAK
ncbi:MAG: hypothetical protein JW818_12975 [Pirellulales bacterium]|nr:hypothetical protein [Pirellulales bacterium]